MTEPRFLAEKGAVAYRIRSKDGIIESEMPAGVANELMRFGEPRIEGRRIVVSDGTSFKLSDFRETGGER